MPTSGSEPPPPGEPPRPPRSDGLAAAPRSGRRDVSAGEMRSAGFVRADATEAVPVEPRRIDKPWGHEIIWAHTDRYVGKILVVNAGEALSLQFHEEKDETLYLLDGELLLEVGPGSGRLVEVPLIAGRSIRLTPGTLHRMVARTDCRILEASTPELDDVVRVQDRYGRAPNRTDAPGGEATRGEATGGGSPQEGEGQ